jgi:hypothetical protein
MLEFRPFGGVVTRTTPAVDPVVIQGEMIMPRKTTTETIAAPRKPASRKRTASTEVRNSPLPKAAAPARPTADQIARRAYEIYLSGSGGSETENWLRAERELCGQ